MKNALDWVVASGEFVGKPVALLNLFSRSIWAPALLKETLTMMTAVVTESTTLQIKNNKACEFDIASDQAVTNALSLALLRFKQAIKEQES